MVLSALVTRAIVYGVSNGPVIEQKDSWNRNEVKKFLWGEQPQFNGKKGFPLSSLRVLFEGTDLRHSNYQMATQYVESSGTNSSLVRDSGNSSDLLGYCIAVQSDMNALLLGTLSITAIIFLILMSAFERRSSFKTHWFNGRFGPVVPLNLLDGYENRFAYSLAFGVTTTYCLAVIVNSSQSILGQRIAAVIDAAPSYVGVFFKIIATVVIATGAYPLFVSIGSRYKRLGAVFGLAYTVTWFSLLCYKLTEIFRVCHVTSQGPIALRLAQEIPQYGCLTLLMLHFLRKIAVSFELPFCVSLTEQSTGNRRNSPIFQHVQSLLRRKDRFDTYRVEQSGCIRTIIAKLRKSIYKSRPDFKYSARIICIFVVSFLTIYMVAISFIPLGLILYEISKAYGNWKRLVDAPPEVRIAFLLSGTDGINMFAYHWASMFFFILTDCYFIAVTVSTIKTWLVLLNMLTWYRTHLTRLRQGDRQWLPVSVRELKGSLSSLTVKSMKFAGYQVAYSVWGYFIFVFVLWIFLGLITVFLIYPLAIGESSFFLRLLYRAWPVLALSLGIYLAQLLTVKYCFLVQKGKLFAIDNRKAFNIVSYYMFFFNIFLGMLSCLLRVLKSLVIGIIFLERVQKSILPSSFELKDPGYSAYIGYILVEHVHSNPVLKVFIHLLSDSVKENEISGSSFGATKSILGYTDRTVAPDLASRIARSNIIRNRWHVAYTLIKNPGLSKFRRHETNNQEKGEDTSAETSFSKRPFRAFDNPCVEMNA